MLTSRRAGADAVPPKLPVDLERRGSCRFHTVMRLARVMRSDDAGLWRVRNLSDTGMMMLTAMPVRAGERLAIALSDSVLIAGRAIWWDGERCGVAFDSPLDCAALLAGLVAERKAPGYRPLRLPVDARAVAHCDQGMHGVRLFSLSQRGADFCHHGRFQPGMAVRLHLAGGGEHRGVIRWSREGKAGMVLLEPLPCATLESAARL